MSDGGNARQRRGRSFARNAVGHHAAVGNAGRKNFLGVNWILGLQSSNQRAQESHVINFIVERIAAAVAGIPRQEFVFVSARSIRINDDEIFFVGLRAHPRLLHRSFRAATAAVQNNHEREGSRIADSRWQMDDVGSLAHPSSGLRDSRRV